MSERTEYAFAASPQSLFSSRSTIKAFCNNLFPSLVGFCVQKMADVKAVWLSIHFARDL
jgi:hypothetical protein